MHGTEGIPISVDTLGGLVTLAGPQSVPVGASPRCYNNDYDVGSTFVRDGLTSAYTFSGAAAGPSPGGNAFDAPTGGIAWHNPGNALLNTGVYASATLASTGSFSSATSAGTSIGGGTPWTNPGNIDSNVSFATATLTGTSSNFTPNTPNGSVSNNAGPSNQSPPAVTKNLGTFPSQTATSATLYVPISVSVAAVQGGGSVAVNYSINSGASWTNISLISSSLSLTLPISISGISNLDTVQVQIVASCGCGPAGYVNISGSVSGWYATVSGSGQLTAQTLQAAISGLSLPAGATITGVGVSFNADYATLAPTFMVGLNVGNVEPSFTLTTTPAVYTAGGPGVLWGYGSWSAATLTSLKVDFFVSASGNSIVNVNTLTVTVYYTAASTLVTDGLNIEQFGFALPSSDTPLGFQVLVNAYCSSGSGTLTVQMLKSGVPVGVPRAVALSNVPQTLTFGDGGDLFGASWLYSDLNTTSFGLQIKGTSSGTSIFVGYTLLKAYFSTSAANFNFITTFTDQDGTVRNLSEDADGNLWVENVTSNPNVLALAFGGITPNSYMTGIEGEGVEYLTFNDGFTGSDLPRLYTPNWIDRITQVGPGAAPSFTPVASSSTTFAISTITQPAQMSDPVAPGHFQAMLWSQGPTSTAAGNVVTIFYAQDNHPQDLVLANAFNAGQAVYVYMSALSAPFVVGTYQVTSVGKATPPGGSAQRWYFTYQVPTSSYTLIGGPDTGTGYYQQTIATMTMTDAVPGLTVGNQVTITGSSVANYDSTWPISQTINSGAMVVTQTQIVSGVATFSYSLSSGVAPVANQPVTITGTTNANGALNLVNATIDSSTGGSSGTFTVNVSFPDATPEAEQGQATTAGTIFTFDPGLLTLGGGTNPIYGNAAGGTLTFAGSGQFVGSGTRQGTVFFITRGGYYTAPAPPVTFTCPSNTAAIAATNIPIGPPNVIARGISFTEAGQNGVPGANFFNIPTPVTYTVNNVQYTADSLIINDNTTTQETFFFTDPVLLSSRAIDVYGFNLFNQIELGNPGWVVNYDSRNFYGLCQNKMQNFNNLSFDGGYLVSTNPLPLGWSTPDQYGSLFVSPTFGNSYFIANNSGGTLAVAGMIAQGAYQDPYGVPIIKPSTSYSVRVTARIPSGITVGNLQVELYDPASLASYGIAAIPFGAMSSAMQIFTVLLSASQISIPATLQLRIYAAAIGDGADVEIDRVDVFPTAIPNLGTTVFGSYAGLPEQVDGVSGQGKFTSENQQPVNGAVVMYDTFYGLKGQGPNASMYSWQASPNLEPAQWTEPEVAQRAGACGPMAFDFGEQWIVTACRNGVYLFEGGQPGKIMQEIYQVWDAINWQAAQTIWVKNDVTGRRLFIGVPLPTPNFWLPNAPVNAAPTSPNVILMCNYQGLDSGEALKSSPQMHTTMFGSLNAIDMRRKWSLWTIAAPYGAFVQTATDKAFYLCNGSANSKVYMLDPNAATDDGAAIDTLYTTAGVPNDGARKDTPQIGDGNVRIGYMNMVCDIDGALQVRFLPNIMLGPGDDATGYNPWTVPGGFNGAGPSRWNRKSSVNFMCTRAFVEFRGPDFNLSGLTLSVSKDSWNAPWGVK